MPVAVATLLSQVGTVARMGRPLLDGCSLHYTERAQDRFATKSVIADRSGSGPAVHAWLTPGDPERETYGASTNRRTVSPRFGVQIVLVQTGADVAFVVTLCVFGATMLLVGEESGQK